MLFGFSHNYYGKLATIVTASDSYDEFSDFGSRDFSDHDHHTTDFLELMTETIFSGLKLPVEVFRHISEEDQKKFADDNSIILIPSETAKGRQITMIEKNKEKQQEDYENSERQLAEAIGEEYQEKTIGELLELDKEDPWQSKDNFHHEQDLETRTSDDSFGSADIIKKLRNEDSLDINIDITENNLNVTAQYKKQNNTELSDDFKKLLKAHNITNYTTKNVEDGDFVDANGEVFTTDCTWDSIGHNMIVVSKIDDVGHVLIKSDTPIVYVVA